GWYASAVITPTPRFDFVLPATERDHDAAIIHQCRGTRWRIPVGILPVESGTARIANGTERRKSLFVIKAIEHGLPLVHFVRPGTRIHLAEIPFLLILLQLDIDCFRALAIVNTRKLGLVAPFIIQLHLVYHIATEVTGYQRRVVAEKLLPIHEHLVYRLSLGCDLAVLVYLDTR